MQERDELSKAAMPTNLKPERPPGQNSTLILTAAIFFAMGFVIAAILFSEGNTEDDGTIAVADNVRVVDVDLAVRGTISALGLASVDDSEADRVNIAVQGTLIALTPTATPLPTAIPVQQTFDTSDPILGDIDSPVVMVEFASYTCGFCGSFHRDTLPALIEHYGDQFAFVVRDFPRSDGEIALNAIARCANEQSSEQFWAFTDQFWHNQVEGQLSLNDETINLFIANAELDAEQLNTCLADNSVYDEVLDDRQEGLMWGVSGTPAFFVNGVPVSGARPLDYFLDLIDDLLREKGIQPPART